MNVYAMCRSSVFSISGTKLGGTVCPDWSSGIKMGQKWYLLWNYWVVSRWATSGINRI